MNIETKHLSDVITNHGQDLSGRVVAITGTTSGTGYICAREVARLGATVLLLNRDSERSVSALARLQEDVPDATFRAVTCDLQDFDSVRRAAAQIKADYDRLDVLCNNAGVMALPDRATSDGYDVQIQTNCISHFLLTRELWDLLLASDDGRVVNHTSMARLGPPLEEKFFGPNGGDLGGDGTDEENKQFSGPRWARYHQTKLANCAFTYGLKQRLDARGIENVKALLAHPGLALTSLQSTSADTGGMDMDAPFMQRAQSAEDGAGGILRACIDPQAESGDFFGPTEGWAGYPDKLSPEPELSSPDNVRINWQGCENAVDTFEI